MHSPKAIAQDILAEARAITRYDLLTTDELVALSRLQVCIYMNSYMDGGAVWCDEAFVSSLKTLAEEIQARCAAAADVLEETKLSQALFDMSRTGVAEQPVALDEHIVRTAISTSDIDYRVSHHALAALMREPFTHQAFDPTRRAQRRYEFTIGGDYFDRTMRMWVAAMEESGAWKGVEEEEALSRLAVMERDFGSMDDVDNVSVIRKVYIHYAAAPARTPSALLLRHTACTCRWDYIPNNEDTEKFLSQCDTLQTSFGTLADRLTLNYIRYSLLADLEDLGV